MLDVLSATVPIFLIVAVGYVVTRMGVLKRADMTVLSTYVVKLALPALIFVSVAGHTLAEVFNPTWLLTYAVAGVAMMGLGKLYARARGRSVERTATLAFAMGGVSSGFVGLPIFLILLPDIAGLSAGMAMIVDNILIIPLVLAMYEAADTRQGSLARRIGLILWRVLTHPMVIAIMLALLLGIFDLELHAILDRSVTLIANSSSAVALFSIGGMLVGLRVHGQAADIAVSVAAKLLLMPSLAVALVIVLPMLGLPALSPELRAAAILMCAMPAMTAMAAIAEQRGDGELGAASMLLSTVLAFVTLSAWMLGLKAVGWL